GPQEDGPGDELGGCTHASRVPAGRAGGKRPPLPGGGAGRGGAGPGGGGARRRAGRLCPRVQGTGGYGGRKPHLYATLRRRARADHPIGGGPRPPSEPEDHHAAEGTERVAAPPHARTPTSLRAVGRTGPM